MRINIPRHEVVVIQYTGGNNPDFENRVNIDIAIFSNAREREGSFKG